MNRNSIDDGTAITDACPSVAIVMDSKIYEPEKLVNELLKDEVSFRRGGRVTLSGGEPLGQPEFAIEVLKLLHAEGIHTAVETALRVSIKIVEDVLPYLDFSQYLPLPSNPDRVIMDSEIIAKASVRFLAAGIGDALATYYGRRGSGNCRSKTGCMHKSDGLSGAHSIHNGFTVLEEMHCLLHREK